MNDEAQLRFTPDICEVEHRLKPGRKMWIFLAYEIRDTIYHYFIGG
jgi:hypothetical protein